MPTISKDSKITIGSSIAIVLALIAGTVQLTRKMDSLESRINALESNNYTVSQAVEAAYSEAMANPGHKVPNPRDPNKLFVVYAGGVETSEGTSGRR